MDGVCIPVKRSPQSIARVHGMSYTPSPAYFLAMIYASLVSLRDSITVAAISLWMRPLHCILAVERVRAAAIAPALKVTVT